MRNPGLVPLLLTTSLLVAAGCADDPATGGEEFPGRVPCASHSGSNGDSSTLRRFDHDEHKRLKSTLTFDGTGAQISAATYRWEDYHLSHYERTTDRLELVIDNHWEDGLLRDETRNDLVTDDGFDGGFTLVNGYRGREQTGEQMDYHNADVTDTVTTITGDRSTRATWTTCSVPDDGFPCGVCVWEQPDGDPAHWTRGECDYDGDGETDDLYQATYDRHFLYLSFTLDTMADGVLEPVERDTLQREDDGTLLWQTFEQFTDGAVTDTYREEFQFVCP